MIPMYNVTWIQSQVDLEITDLEKLVRQSWMLDYQFSLIYLKVKGRNSSEEVVIDAERSKAAKSPWHLFSIMYSI